MKILTAEIALRDETRTLGQAQPQLKKTKFEKTATQLSQTQIQLTQRTDTVIEKIIDLPNGDVDFRKEIAQLTNAANAMNDAEEILSKPDAGVPAIAAETEAIEWLLMAKRGGSGSGSPGGGNRSGADLNSSALALIGNSKEKNAQVKDRETDQATGKSGRELPEEFRSGLDRYFEVLEGNL